MRYGMDRLGELTRAELPTALDMLVQQRMHAALSAQNSHGKAGRDGTAPTRMPLMEGCVYAAGLAAYGLLAMSSAARLLLRAVAG